MAGGKSKKADDAQASAAGATGPGFPVGATLVARWMGQAERTCVVIDRRAYRALDPLEQCVVVASHQLSQCLLTCTCALVCAGGDRVSCVYMSL